MNLIEHLNELAVIRAGGGPSEENYDPELLMFLTGAADTLEDLKTALERMVAHFAMLPASMDEPGSVMAQARAALAKLEGEPE